MRYLLQRPLPDEILTSTLVRTCRRFHIPIKQLMGMFGPNTNAPSFFHMSNLSAYAGAMGLETSTLLETSTVFTTLAAFQPSERRQAYRVAAAEGVFSQEVGFSAFQSAATYVPLRRLCLLCARADKSRYGVSYWHLSHHLPGVSLCAQHGTRLRASSLTTLSGAGRWSYQMPDEVDSKPLGSRTTVFDIELNKLVLSTQSGQAPGAVAPLPAGFYREELVRAGLVSEDRQVNASSARHWIGKNLKGVAGAGGLLQFDPTLSWVDLILRERPGIPFPSCKHLIIQAALASTPRPESPILDHISTGFRGRPLGDLDVVKAKELDARIRARLKSPEKFTLQQELEGVGIWGAFRHNRLKYPAVARVAAKHRAAMMQRKMRAVRTAGVKRLADSRPVTAQQRVSLKHAFPSPAS